MILVVPRVIGRHNLKQTNGNQNQSDDDYTGKHVPGFHSVPPLSDASIVRLLLQEVLYLQETRPS